MKSKTSALILFLTMTVPMANDRIAVAAPMTTDLAGRSGTTALRSVYRVMCPSRGLSGTGFLHKSGKVITAAHVIQNCPASGIAIVNISGNVYQVSSISQDVALDLAILSPKTKIIGSEALPISSSDQYAIGSQVSTWGFPAGYQGLAPLLSSGYLSGTDKVALPKGTEPVSQLIVNAAFNSGNSGGPLIEIENGTVIGVVSSKLAPLPDHIEQALSVLKENKGITQFTRKNRDGSEEKLSTDNVVEEVLQYLRSQTQLVIGFAVAPGDLRTFLKKNGIEP